VEPEEPFLRQLRHFVDVIHGRAQPLVTAADALGTLEAALAVQQGLRGRS
jgi:predicted dehydrogenase